MIVAVPQRCVRVVGILCCVVLTALSAFAQESRGSIAGLVLDTSGGALPGATVSVVNTGTNSRTMAVTNEAGQYAALFLLPGTYTVTVELSGFQTKEHTNVLVRVGERAQVDVLRREVLVGVGDPDQGSLELLVGEAGALDPGALQGPVAADELAAATRVLGHQLSPLSNESGSGGGIGPSAASTAAALASKESSSP